MKIRRRINRFRFQCSVYLKRLVNEFLYSVGARGVVVARYPYNFSAQQLRFLCECIDATAHIEGGIAEVGCERGSTTLFLCNYLDAGGSSKAYTALDTFRGFVRGDIDFEVEHREKKAWMYSAYQVNSRKWFEHSMRLHGANRVTALEVDVNEYDLRNLGKLALVLLDVDLYRPVRKALPEVYDMLSPGGIIIVDDCDRGSFWWDGAYQAYVDFVASMGIDKNILYGKMGVIRKPL